MAEHDESIAVNDQDSAGQKEPTTPEIRIPNVELKRFHKSSLETLAPIFAKAEEEINKNAKMSGLRKSFKKAQAMISKDIKQLIGDEDITSVEQLEVVCIRLGKLIGQTKGKLRANSLSYLQTVLRDELTAAQEHFSLENERWHVSVTPEPEVPDVTQYMQPEQSVPPPLPETEPVQLQTADIWEVPEDRATLTETALLNLVSDTWIYKFDAFKNVEQVNERPMLSAEEEITDTNFEIICGFLKALAEEIFAIRQHVLERGAAESVFGKIRRLPLSCRNALRIVIDSISEDRINTPHPDLIPQLERALEEIEEKLQNPDKQLLMQWGIEYTASGDELTMEELRFPERLLMPDTTDLMQIRQEEPDFEWSFSSGDVDLLEKRYKRPAHKRKLDTEYECKQIANGLNEVNHGGMDVIQPEDVKQWIQEKKLFELQEQMPVAMEKLVALAKELHAKTICQAYARFVHSKTQEHATEDGITIHEIGAIWGQADIFDLATTCAEKAVADRVANLDMQSEDGQQKCAAVFTEDNTKIHASSLASFAAELNVGEKNLASEMLPVPDAAFSELKARAEHPIDLLNYESSVDVVQYGRQLLLDGREYNEAEIPLLDIEKSRALTMLKGLAYRGDINLENPDDTNVALTTLSSMGFFEAHANLFNDQYHAGSDYRKHDGALQEETIALLSDIANDISSRKAEVEERYNAIFSEELGDSLEQRQWPTERQVQQAARRIIVECRQNAYGDNFPKLRRALLSRFEDANIRVQRDFAYPNPTPYQDGEPVEYREHTRSRLNDEYAYLIPKLEAAVKQEKPLSADQLDALHDSVRQHVFQGNRIYKEADLRETILRLQERMFHVAGLEIETDEMATTEAKPVTKEAVTEAVVETTEETTIEEVEQPTEEEGEPVPEEAEQLTGEEAIEEIAEGPVVEDVEQPTTVGAIEELVPEEAEQLTEEVAEPVALHPLQANRLNAFDNLAAKLQSFELHINPEPSTFERMSATISEQQAALASLEEQFDTALHEAEQCYAQLSIMLMFLRQNARGTLMTPEDFAKHARRTTDECQEHIAEFNEHLATLKQLNDKVEDLRTDHVNPLVEEEETVRIGSQTVVRTLEKLRRDMSALFGVEMDQVIPQDILATLEETDETKFSRQEVGRRMRNLTGRLQQLSARTASPTISSHDVAVTLDERDSLLGIIRSVRPSEEGESHQGLTPMQARVLQIAQLDIPRADGQDTQTRSLGVRIDKLVHYWPEQWGDCPDKEGILETIAPIARDIRDQEITGKPKKADCANISEPLIIWRRGKAGSRFRTYVLCSPAGYDIRLDEHPHVLQGAQVDTIIEAKVLLALEEAMFGTTGSEADLLAYVAHVYNNDEINEDIANKRSHSVLERCRDLGISQEAAEAAVSRGKNRY